MRLRGCGSLLFLDVFVILLCLSSCVFLHADGAAFDLVGPKVDVRVQRAGHTLPIAQVPNLQPGDRLWIHPDLPDSQSVHYLMVVVFLRGATNPPPESWFTRTETWAKAVHAEGIYVVVPEEAEQALILLAPETGGAFSTLRSAVRGKPGAFVRAAQDLEQLGLDRLRLQTYLDAVRETSENDPEDLKSRSTLLARSLNIKLDQQCFDKPSAQQAPCLTQNTEQLVLDDAHSQSMVATLTTGAPTDLLAQLSSTHTAGSGYYSPYIGAVVDVVRILGTTHTAQYQYIPALAQPKKDTLNLRLNNPPSFRNPKSVLVIGLPPVRQPVLPPLRAVNANEIFCADKPGLVLPADGAPLAFATEMAHNLELHIETKTGEGIDLPVHPDPARGGFVVESHKGQLAQLAGEFSGKLHGDWGFGSFDGPRFRLRASRPGTWVVASKDASALIVGREDLLHLQSEDACCVSGVQMLHEDGKSVTIAWKTPKPDELEVSVPLQSGEPGTLKMLVSKFGLREPDEVPLHTYAEAGRLDGFAIHAGDADGILRGTRLDQVTALDVNGVSFAPANLTRANQHDELRVVAPAAAAVLKLQPGEALVLHAKLKDGRTLDLKSSMEAARPRLALLSKSIQLEESDPPPLIHLANADELPQDGRLNFFLKAQVPDSFSPNEKVEVATADDSFHVLLSVKDGNLTLQDAKTIYAVLDPMKLLGPSAFGPLKFRALSGDGVEGDWQPLVNLVRMPGLKGVRCVAASRTPAAAKSLDEDAVHISSVQPQNSSVEDTPKIVSEKSTVAEKECALTGDKLFLIDAVSVDPDFANSVTVPDGFIEDALRIPQPKDKTLYIKLRDDPGTVDTAVVPMLSVQP